MRILVPFKIVIDPDSLIYGGVADQASAPQVINPFDHIALEEAARFRESGVAEEAIGVTIGREEKDQFLTALAMGMDKVLHLEDDRPLDPYAVARILRAVVDDLSPDLVILGKQAVDDDSNQVAQMVAALLGWPQATFVSKITLENANKSALCKRETDAGLEEIRVQLPAVLSTDLRLNEPRYISRPAKIKARKKPIETKVVADYGVDVSPKREVLETRSAPVREAGAIVSSVGELVQKLREEAKVI